MGDVILSGLDVVGPNRATAVQNNPIENHKNQVLHVTFNDTIEDGEHSEISEDDDHNGHQLTQNKPPEPRKISQKKRSEIAGFGEWLEENREQVSQETTERKSREIDEMSVNYLVQGMEGNKIITSPRDYQVELFERAKEMNTIAVLDTGSGKTLIAALLLQWVIDNELEDRAVGLPKRISFFLVCPPVFNIILCLITVIRSTKSH